MTDDPVPEDVDAGEPLAELADLAEPLSPTFVENVLDGVARRQTSSRMLEVVWWGWTSLLLEMIQVLFKALGVRDTSERKD